MTVGWLSNICLKWKRKNATNYHYCRHRDRASNVTNIGWDVSSGREKKCKVLSKLLCLKYVRYFNAARDFGGWFFFFFFTVLPPCWRGSASLPDTVRTTVWRTARTSRGRSSWCSARRQSRRTASTPRGTRNRPRRTGTLCKGELRNVENVAPCITSIFFSHISCPT